MLMDHCGFTPRTCTDWILFMELRMRNPVSRGITIITSGRTCLSASYVTLAFYEKILFIARFMFCAIIICGRLRYHISNSFRPQGRLPNVFTARGTEQHQLAKGWGGGLTTSEQMAFASMSNIGDRLFYIGIK